MSISNVKPGQLRSLTIALLVVALLLPGVQLLMRSANAVSNKVLDENWRGAFDILVTAKGFEEAVSPGKNELGLSFLDPNYGSVAAPTLSRDQVAEVAKLDDVQFAAPLAYLGVQVKVEHGFLLVVPWSAFADGETQRFRLIATAIGSDGLTERVDDTALEDIEVDISGWNGKYGNVRYSDDPDQAGDGIKATWLNWNFKMHWIAREEGVAVVVGRVPSGITTVAAVDPEEEAKLLGKDAEILDPLVRVEKLVAEHGPITPVKVRELEENRPEWLAELAEYPGYDPKKGYFAWGGFGDESELAPYIRNYAPPATAKYRVEFQQKKDGVFVDLGTTEAKASEVFRPFGVHRLEVPWPGVGLVDESIADTTGLLGFLGLKAGPLKLEQRTDDAGLPGFEVVPQSFTSLIHHHKDFVPTGLTPGDYRNYRPAENTNLQIGTIYGPGVAPFEVGGYEPVTRSATDIYAPLGLYESNPVRTKSGKVLEPSTTGAGLVAETATAIVSLDTAEKLVEGDYVTAVRVRVAGLDGATRKQAQLEIDRVAQQIRAKGLSAKIVAGASQQEVSFYVPSYAHGTLNRDGPQEIKDLGWVTQTFTVLGSDQWTEGTTTAVTTASGIILLALVVLGLLVIMLLLRPSRLRTQNLLRALGYTWVQRIGWAIRDSSLGLILLGAGIVVSLLLSTPENLPQTLLLAAVIVLAVLVSVPIARNEQQRLPSKFGLRRTIFGISVLESVLAAVCAVIIFGLAQIALWFWQTGSRLSLSRLVLESLLPLAAMILVVLAFLVYLQFVAAGYYQQLLQARVIFAYEMLAQSQQRIMARQILLLLAKLLFVIALLAIVGLFALQWIDPEPVALLAAGGWLAAWVAVRLFVVMQMRPARLLNS